MARNSPGSQWSHALDGRYLSSSESQGVTAFCTLCFSDLRFQNADSEAAFRERMQESSSWLASFASLTHVALQAVVTSGWFFSRRDRTITVGVLDLLYLFAQGIAAIGMIIVGTGCMLKELLGRKCLFSEPLWACAIGISIIAAFLQGPLGQSLLGAENAELTESQPCEGDLEVSAYLLSVFLSIYCYTLPIRCCYLSILVLFAMLSLVLQAFSGGSRAPDGFTIAPRVANILLTLLLLASSYSAAYSAEKREREQVIRWSSKEHFFNKPLRQKALSRATLDQDLRVFRSMGCSLAFGLLRDLRISCGSLRAARNAFQSGSSASLVGESFLSLVVEPHRSRFQRLCEEATGSRVPRLLRLHLCFPDGPKPVEVVVLHHAAGGREFLVGIKQGRCMAEVPGVQRQGACAAVDVPSDGHPFAVEDVQDSPLHVPADASESLCYTRSDMEPADERATCGTQSEAAPGAEKCVGTAIVWREDRFRCSNCSRPPWPPDELLWEDAQRHTRHHERRRSGHEMLESLTGTWTVNPQFEHIAQPFIKHLTFRHGKCIDAFGQKRKVTEAGDHVFLLNGRIWLHNGVLFREGRSGIVMHFHRTDWPEADKDEDGEAIFDEDEDPNSLDLLQEMVFAHDAPLLS